MENKTTMEKAVLETNSVFRKSMMNRSDGCKASTGKLLHQLRPHARLAMREAFRLVVWNTLFNGDVGG